MNDTELHRLVRYLDDQVSGSRSETRRYGAQRQRAFIGVGLFLGAPRVSQALRLQWDQFRYLDRPGAAAVENLVGQKAVPRYLPLPEQARRWLLEYQRAALGDVGIATGPLFPGSEDMFYQMLPYLSRRTGTHLTWIALVATYRRRLQLTGAHPEVVAYMLGEDRPLLTRAGHRVLLPDPRDLNLLVGRLSL